MKNPTRRGLLKNAAAAAAGVTGVAALSSTQQGAGRGKSNWFAGNARRSR